MVKKLPDRWEAYSAIGMQIPGTRIISFKVPLKENVANQLPPQKRLSIPILLEKVPDLGLVIDLTLTTKYYNKNDLLDRGVSYAKIACPGQQLPNDRLVARFFSAIDTYLEKHSNDNTLIGVHCTHGVNRTGYLIARYLIEKLGFSSQDAISIVGKMRGHPIERAPYTRSLSRCMPINYGSRGTPRSKDIEEPSRPTSEFWPKKDTGSGKDIAKLERGQVYGKNDIELGRVKSWDKHQPSTSRGPRTENIPERFENPDVFRPMRIKEEIAFEKQYHPRHEVHVGGAPRVKKVKTDYPQNELYSYNHHVQDPMPKYQEPYSRNQYREEKPQKEKPERFERHHEYPRGRSPVEEYSKPPDQKHTDLVYHRAIREEIRIDYAPPIHREKEVYPDRDYEHRNYEFNHKDASFHPRSRYVEKEIRSDRHIERERKEEIRSSPRRFDADYGRDDFHSSFSKSHSFRERSPHRQPEERKHYEQNYDVGHGEVDRRRKSDRGYPKYSKPEIEERKYWPREDEVRNKRIDSERSFSDDFRGRDTRKFDSAHEDGIQYDDHVRNQRVPEERHFASGSSFHGDSRSRPYEEKRHERRNYEQPERKRDFIEPVRERYEDFRPQERSERNTQRRNFSPEKTYEKPYHSNDYPLRDEEYANHRDFIKTETRRMSPVYPPQEEIYNKVRRSPDIRSRSERFEKEFLPNDNFRRDDRRLSRRDRHWNSVEKVIQPRIKSEERPLSPDRFPRRLEIIEPDFPRRSRSRDRRSRERTAPKSINNGSRPDLREEIKLKRTHRELSIGHDRRTQSPLIREPRMSTEERDCRELINLKRGSNFSEPELPNWGKRDRPENPADAWQEPPRKRFRESPAVNEGSPRWKHKPIESGSRRGAGWVPKSTHENVRTDISTIARSSSRGRGRGSRPPGKKVFDRLKRKPWE